MFYLGNRKTHVLLLVCKVHTIKYLQIKYKQYNNGIIKTTYRVWIIIPILWPVFCHRRVARDLSASQISPSNASGTSGKQHNGHKPPVAEDWSKNRNYNSYSVSSSYNSIILVPSLLPRRRSTRLQSPCLRDQHKNIYTIYKKFLLVSGTTRIVPNTSVSATPRREMYIALVRSRKSIQNTVSKGLSSSKICPFNLPGHRRW